MGKLATFIALDGAARIAAIEAMAELVRASLLVALVPPRRWRRRFGPASAPPATRSAPADARLVAEAIARALRNLPFAPLCLPQALAARAMLARRGVDGEIRLGVRRGDAAGGTPRFHAWCKVGPHWVTGRCDEAAYALLTPAR